MSRRFETTLVTTHADIEIGVTSSGRFVADVPNPDRSEEADPTIVVNEATLARPRTTIIPE